MITRTFTEEDIPTLCGWIKDARSNWLWGGPAFNYPLSAASVAAHIQQPEVSPFLLLEAGKAVGYFDLFRVSETELRLCRVLIGNPACRGKGKGKELVALALQIAGENSAIKTLSLAVFETNSAALKCYQSMGFKTLEHETKTRVFEGREWVLFRMRKSLSPS